VIFGSPQPIHWDRLARAVEFYRHMGFRYVEVPWAVTPSVTKLTLPAGIESFHVGERDLIGSAEQGLLQLIKAGFLPPGKYVACSPCFRNERQLDDLHQHRFMKVELIDTSSDQDLRELLSFARHFFSMEGAEVVETLQTDSRNPAWPQIDLEWGGIELGSYGTRTIDGLTWTYGTGVSEPRFSHVTELVARS